MIEHSDLWGLTCYFNPGGYRSRRDNFRIFRQQLGIPLLVIELSFGPEFELTNDDGEILLQVCDADLMWQKEKLLNRALLELPEEVNRVAWLDCDVVFPNRDWHVAASRKLDEFALIHLFDTAYDLTPTETRTFAAGSPVQPRNAGRSALAAWAEGDVNTNAFSSNLRMERLHTGLAWAARREALAPTGLYDLCIMGSGNRAMACAAFGLFEQATQYLHMNDQQVESYRGWAERHHGIVGGEVTALPQAIYHLWHGELSDRKYSERHRSFAQYGFDPASDLRVSEDGCWKWNTEKPEMHDFVSRYLRSRKEDG